MRTQPLAGLVCGRENRNGNTDEENTHTLSVSQYNHTHITHYMMKIAYIYEWSPDRAKKQYGKDVYDRVTRSESKKRPVCVVGPGSTNMATDIASNDKFTLCSSLKDVLSAYAKVTTHKHGNN